MATIVVTNVTGIRYPTSFNSLVLFNIEHFATEDVVLSMIRTGSPLNITSSIRQNLTEGTG